MLLEYILTIKLYLNLRKQLICDGLDIIKLNKFVLFINCIHSNIFVSHIFLYFQTIILKFNLNY